MRWQSFCVLNPKTIYRAGLKPPVCLFLSFTLAQRVIREVVLCFFESLTCVKDHDYFPFEFICMIIMTFVWDIFSKIITWIFLFGTFLLLRTYSIITLCFLQKHPSKVFLFQFNSIFFSTKCKRGGRKRRSENQYVINWRTINIRNGSRFEIKNLFIAQRTNSTHNFLLSISLSLCFLDRWPWNSQALEGTHQYSHFCPTGKPTGVTEHMRYIKSCFEGFKSIPGLTKKMMRSHRKRWGKVLRNPIFLSCSFLLDT